MRSIPFSTSAVAAVWRAEIILDAPGPTIEKWLRGGDEDSEAHENWGGTWLAT